MPPVVNIGNNIRLRAEVDKGSVNKQSRTIDVVFATEYPVRNYDYSNGRYFNEILVCSPDAVDLSRLNNGAPFLDNHNRYSTENVLGVVERAWVENGKCKATIRLSDREDVRGITNDILDGIITGVSAGYKVERYEASEPEEGSEVWTYRAIKWSPREISSAPVQADPDSSTQRSASDGQYTVPISNPSKAMTPEEIEKLRKENEELERKLKEEQERKANPAPAPVPAPAPAPAPATPNAEEAARKAIEDERKRTADITEAVRKAGLDAAFAQPLIANGTTIDQARALILEEMGKNTPHTRSHASVGADERDKWRNIAEIGMTLRSGQVDEKKFTAEEVSAAREFRGRRLTDIARECLERAGEDVRQYHDDMALVKRAITSHSSDFPILLEGTNRRVLLAAFQTVPDTWRQLATTGSVGDFREYKRLRMLSSFNKLDKLQEDGEYKNLKINDAEFEKVSVDTYGNTINVSRKMIVNDDLASFTRLAGMLGRAAARSIELDFYNLLALNSGNGPTMNDGNPLFHSSHGNIATTAAALSVASIEAARVQMATQKQLGGVDDYLDIRPSVLWCPIGMGGQARVINDSQYDVDVQNKTSFYPNKVRGLFGNIIDTPRLSGTAWYVLAAPSDEPVFEVNFLNGVQTPYMESESPFEYDGLRWKIRYDYGVGVIGFRGILKNAGA